MVNNLTLSTLDPSAIMELEKQRLSFADDLRAIPGLMNSFLFGWMRLGAKAFMADRA